LTRTVGINTPAFLWAENRELYQHFRGSDKGCFNTGEVRFPQRIAEKAAQGEQFDSRFAKHLPRVIPSTLASAPVTRISLDMPSWADYFRATFSRERAGSRSQAFAGPKVPDIGSVPMLTHKL